MPPSLLPVTPFLLPIISFSISPSFLFINYILLIVLSRLSVWPDHPLSDDLSPFSVQPFLLLYFQFGLISSLFNSLHPFPVLPVPFPSSLHPPPCPPRLSRSERATSVWVHLSCVCLSPAVKPCTFFRANLFVRAVLTCAQWTVVENWTPVLVVSSLESSWDEDALSLALGEGQRSVLW